MRQSPQTVQNVVTYDVVVGVDNKDLALKPGMTASTQIVTDQRADVSRVPDQALRYTPAGTAKDANPAVAPATTTAVTPGTVTAAEPAARVWVLRGGKPVAIAVVLGLDDDSYTEIVSGDLKPGDAVITAEQRGATARGASPIPRL